MCIENPDLMLTEARKRFRSRGADWDTPPAVFEPFFGNTLLGCADQPRRARPGEPCFRQLT